ncbi:hypothetical protein HUJ05_007857 [Dendroctonus ponderosae]|nr:hypothetical protein HUJ05_007857 [Dendroctonus ponderosae]
MSPRVWSIRIVISHNDKIQINKRLWQAKIKWDESLPTDLHTQWLNLFNDLQHVEQIVVSRHAFSNNYKAMYMHGFSDASERAYGACIYIVSTGDDGSKHSQLLCSKSRVAHIKTISLPRLELCGALVLSKLTSICANVLEIPKASIYLHTDSSIVLAWLSREPSIFKTFIANRT